MARNGASLLVLLLVCCFLVATFARKLDNTQRSLVRPEDANRGLASKKQGPISSLAETGDAKGNSVSSVLYHGTGHEENALTHETGHEENSIPTSALHLQPELLLNDRIMSSASRIRDEESTFLSSLSGAEDWFLPVLSHSDDILLHEPEVFLHDDDTIPSYLVQNGLPIGLLPSSVASYSITDDGDFTISLQKACYAKFDYEVHYAQTITGKLSYGTITDLSGILAKEGFFWAPVTGVRIDSSSSEYIYFDAGPISKKLSISQFQAIPVCKVKAMASSALA